MSDQVNLRTEHSGGVAIKFRNALVDRETGTTGGAVVCIAVIWVAVSIDCALHIHQREFGAAAFMGLLSFLVLAMFMVAFEQWITKG